MLDIQDRLDAQGRIRPMARHDVAIVAGLAARLARHHGDEPALEAGQLEADLFGPAAGLQGLVAERFGYVVGYALILPREGAQEAGAQGIALHQLFVMEGSRGLGLGRKLIEGAADVARGAGAGHLRIGLLARTEKARPFYRALGFTPGDGEGAPVTLALLEGASRQAQPRAPAEAGA